MMKSTNKPIGRLVLTASILAIMTKAWAADPDYPREPVRMVVPFAAGGPTDTLARVLADAMSERLGQRVFVENKPGVGGNVGTAQFTRMPPDGYSLLLTTNGPLVANQMMFKNLGYDPQKDLQPVSFVAYLPNMVAVHPSVPAASIKELIAELKAHPKKYSFASGGEGTSTHFAGELLKSMADVQMTHIPYRGDGASLPNVVGGQVPIVFGSIFATKRFVDSGMLRGLAVTSLDRVPSMPDVPTVAESGLEGYDLTAWYGVVVPTGTPEPILEKLSKTIAEVVTAPDFRQKIEAMSGIPRSTTPDEFAQFIESERPKWKKLIEDSGIQIN
ncbi:tripartite tricarboxylate transporter substrate binding protein [Verticiella sediminum]|uniref:Tripartite tricarboxylate transporter substrate binding protein n=1 Tax=Verticiella sediminum TaxID=1247510 RepID=A0A556AJ33_9BURK|nr:tripartite tricarboxylate transporter substrate binding protein [Verticiella sediminum]TSH92912.1 tripartite tricarboxylate transporter substrate binding protein [Verticiella sediminum]